MQLNEICFKLNLSQTQSYHLFNFFSSLLALFDCLKLMVTFDSISRNAICFELLLALFLRLFNL